MSKTSVASCLMAIMSLAACGGPAEVEDEKETSSDSSALMAFDDFPAPVEVPGPVPVQEFRLQRPLWDLQPYLDEYQQHPRLGVRCVMHWVQIYDPVRERSIDVPVTICP